MRMFAASVVAIYEMIYNGTISVKTTLGKVKYLSNIIEQDHRFIKRKVKPMLGFDSFKTAENAICGIETMHMIRKGQGDIKELGKQVFPVESIMENIDAIDEMINAIKFLLRGNDIGKWKIILQNKIFQIQLSYNMCDFLL